MLAGLAGLQLAAGASLEVTSPDRYEQSEERR